MYILYFIVLSYRKNGASSAVDCIIIRVGKTGAGEGLSTPLPKKKKKFVGVKKWDFVILA